MQTSAAEFLLLLKKWMDESTEVLVAAAFAPPAGTSAIFRLSGTVQIDVSESTFAVQSQVGDSLFICHLAAAGLQYLMRADVSEPDIIKMTGLSPDRIEDMGVIQLAEGETIVVLSLTVISR